MDQIFSRSMFDCEEYGSRGHNRCSILLRKKSYKNLAYRSKSKLTASMSRELYGLERCSRMQIQRSPFKRAMRGIAQNFRTNLRFKAEAVDVIQEAAETYITNLFEDAYICALHAKRETILPDDINLALCVRKDPIFM